MFSNLIFEIPLAQFLGIVGATLYILNYALLTARITNSDCVLYFVTNLAAASLVMFSLSHEFNVASLIIQCFFIAVSVAGILTRLSRSRRRTANAARMRPLT